MLFLPSLRGRERLETCRAFLRAICALPCGSESYALRVGRVRAARAYQDLRASAQICFSGVSSHAAIGWDLNDLLSSPQAGVAAKKWINEWPCELAGK